MSKVYAVDIETVCGVETCPGVGKWHKCNHALDPHRGRISQVGIWSPEYKEVFRSPEAFYNWYQNENVMMIGQNFKFDLKFLKVQWGFDLSGFWLGDTQLMGSLYSPKIPDEWIADYNAKRDELNKGREEPLRKGSKHSLKTMAPYYLDVEPFWETLGMESDDYVLLDCEYTYRLFEFFISRRDSYDPHKFYDKFMFPAEKFLLGVELRGLTLDLDQLAKDEEAALKEIKEIERKLEDIWVDAFNAWDEEQKEKIRDKYMKMLDTARSKKKALIQWETRSCDYATLVSAKPPKLSLND